MDIHYKLNKGSSIVTQFVLLYANSVYNSKSKKNS